MKREVCYDTNSAEKIDPNPSPIPQQSTAIEKKRILKDKYNRKNRANQQTDC